MKTAAPQLRRDKRAFRFGLGRGRLGSTKAYEMGCEGGFLCTNAGLHFLIQGICSKRATSSRRSMFFQLCFGWRHRRDEVWCFQFSPSLTSVRKWGRVMVVFESLLEMLMVCSCRYDNDDGCTYFCFDAAATSGCLNVKEGSEFCGACIDCIDDDMKWMTDIVKMTSHFVELQHILRS
ncbi:hypothetical protein M758_1G125000 [Ceratodon purpureus]|nr:hypothetical protein M758_1G125000 [Ceratodon purpureus]